MLQLLDNVLGQFRIANLDQHLVVPIDMGPLIDSTSTQIAAERLMASFG